MSINDFIKKSKDEIVYNIIATTAMQTEANPIYAVLETQIAGMSNDISLNARLLATGSSYLGIGYLYGKGRQLSRKIFGIKEESKERIQTLHDLLYTASFNLATCPLLYFICGSRDLKQIGIATACAIGIGAVNGIPMGYAVDVAKDLTGIKKCNRLSYPNFIRKQSPLIKKGIFALLIVGSIGLTAGVYNFLPEHKNTSQSVEIEKVDVITKQN